MTYKEAIAYKDSTIQYGSVPGLRTIRELMKRLGNPQDTLHYVHIAGTNGKGSVSAYTASVLKQAGYKTGSYNSPPVYEYREFARINGRNISEVNYANYMEQVCTAAEAMAAEGLAHPTVFEIETALAFLFFADKQCDIVVLEAGMGGELDATNIIQAPDVAVLTSISMDHASYLGHTPTEIAANKAGIIKEGCQAVFLAQEQTMQAITTRCQEQGVPYTAVYPEEAERIRNAFPKQTFSYRNYQKLKISLQGMYQIDNAILAVNVIEQLSNIGYKIHDRQLRQGLEEAVWPGRFDVICKKPLFLLDGAHNEDAARRLAESIELYFTNRRIIYIMGVLKDKDYEKLCELTAGYASDIITVATPHNSRALPALELAETVRRYHEKVTAADSIEEAVELALLLAQMSAGDEQPVIIAFGSLSYLGEVHQIMQHREQIRSDSHGRQRED